MKDLLSELESKGFCILENIFTNDQLSEFKKKFTECEEEVQTTWEGREVIGHGTCSAQGLWFIENDKEIVITNDKDKAKVLSEQYKSVWSNPKSDYIVDDIDKFFEGCIMCHNQKFHICEKDIFIENVMNNYSDYLLIINDLNDPKDTISEIEFSHKNIMDTI